MGVLITQDLCRGDRGWRWHGPLTYIFFGDEFLMNAAQSTFLGSNLAGIADWSTQYPFLNYFKSSRDWITHTDSTWNTREGDKLRVDGDGWVTSLEGG